MQTFVSDFKSKFIWTVGYGYLSVIIGIRKSSPLLAQLYSTKLSLLVKERKIYSQIHIYHIRDNISIIRESSLGVCAYSK